MTKRPTPLPVQLERVPADLRAIPRWLLWRYVAKTKPNGQTHWAKVPYQANGREAKSNTPNTWCSWDDAVDALIIGDDRGNTFDGLGFVFVGDDGIVGIDLDDCVDAAGNYSEMAAELLDRVDGYAEVSPSGTGIKIFTRADLERAFKDNTKGIELYKQGRYFTVTGHGVNGHSALPEQSQDLGWFVEKHFGQRATRSAQTVATTTADAFALYRPPLTDWPLDRVVCELLAQLDPDCGHDDWLQVGMALHHQGQGADDWLNAWDEWSAGSGKYVEGEPEARWRSFSQQRFQGTGATTLASVIWMVRQRNLTQAQAAGQLVLNAKDYVGNARELADRRFTGPEGLILRHMSELWYWWRGTHYVESESTWVRKETWDFLDQAHTTNRTGQVVRFLPEPKHVNGVIDATKALTHLERARPPMWLNGFVGPDPKDVVSLTNGLFHIPSRTLLPHTAGFFTLNTLPFAWDPTATAPTWERFLADLWADDPQSIETLQEVFGYIVCADTSMQKIFMLIGPKRSGKGTIGRVLTSLIGPENICGPTLASLTQQFGLQPMIGKLLAVIADARAPGNNHQMIVERLLMMSGEDTITVDRKNLEAWVGTLTSRILMMTNEALQLGDASGALVGRLVVLPITTSFYGREDRTLTSRLLQELPGIFNWALDGRARLYQRGFFQQPDSGQTMIDEMQALNSPIAEFVSRFCELGADFHEDQGLVFTAWQRYCMKRDKRAGTPELFAKQIYASQSSVKLVRPRVEGQQVRHFGGLKLKDEIRKKVEPFFKDSDDDFF